MKLREIFRFELTYQVRRVSTWIYFAALVLFASVWTTEEYLGHARDGEYFFGAAFVVAEVTVVGCLFWILVAAYVAGDAAARDAETGMHPLIFTTPVRKADYLGGRFLAAFVLNASLLLAVPTGILLAVYSAGVGAEIRGPFRPAAYLTAYAFIALPIAFGTTAVQFSFAALGRRAIASYLGSLLLFVTAFVLDILLEPDVGRLLDPLGVIAMDDLRSGWTPLELNTRVIALEGWWIGNRLLWLGVAVGTLVLTHFRFRFGHHSAITWWSRMTRRRDAHSPTPADTGSLGSTSISVPQVRRTFGLATHARQTRAIAWTSFGSIAKSRGGFLLLAVVAMLAVVCVDLGQLGVPLLPRSDYILRGLTFPGVPPAYLIIPLLIVFCSGRLARRERDAGLSEMVDAAPVPEWVLFLGRFLGLGLVLALCMALRMAAGLLAQVGNGYHEFEIGLYLQILFGIQLAHYLLFALLAIVVHVVVNQRHVGHLVVFAAYLCMVAPGVLGIEHNLLVYGSAPRWSYTDMRGFGPSLEPWLWFNLYWAAWALMLAVVARLLWVRGKERGLGVRLQLARRRFTLPTAGTAATAVGFIVTLGAFVFYNTNVLNEYLTASDQMERRAEYERRYGQYEGVPQPRLTGTNLHVEIDPERRVLDIRGTYHLVNRSDLPIASIHLTSEVEPRGVDFDRPATCVLDDEVFGHRIYALEESLQPGESLQLSFEVHSEPHGFRNTGVDASLAANGTFFWNYDWLPAIGYQPTRALRDAGDRQAHGLPPRPAFPSLDDVEARQDLTGSEQIVFEAVVGTDRGQIAVAPGALRRTWTEGGRRYFRYSTDAPIGNQYAFFSANYAVHEGQWKDPHGSGKVLAVQIFHHPGHAANLDRMLRSVRASLSYYTEQFGPYPHGHIRLVEHPGHDGGLHSEATTITHDEVLSLFNADDDARGLDLVFFGVAHEVAHQWWGAQLPCARVEGVGLLIESLAQYSAMRVVEEACGDEQFRGFLSWMRQPAPIRPVRATVPVLRATAPYLSYRKGPFAIYTLSEYVGKDRVNDALRRFLEKHGSGAPPLPTSLDLYRELQAVTPDSLRSLLHDLFEANTFWELETDRATAERTEAGTWQVTLDVQARKVVVDCEGVETLVPMDDWMEIGVFAPADEGEGLGEALYMQRHRIRSGEQTITVTVPREPAHAGIDPHRLLIDPEMRDNIEEVTVEPRPAPPSLSGSGPRSRTRRWRSRATACSRSSSRAGSTTASGKSEDGATAAGIKPDVGAHPVFSSPRAMPMTVDFKARSIS